jgi:hypothetical protein
MTVGMLDQYLTLTKNVELRIKVSIPLICR